MESMICFFTGHIEEETNVIYTPQVYWIDHRDTLKVQEDILCPRCSALLFTRDATDAPEHWPHEAMVLRRKNVVDRTDIFYPSCWCGWLGNEYVSWFSAYDEQLAHLNENGIFPYEEPT